MKSGCCLFATFHAYQISKQWEDRGGVAALPSSVSASGKSNSRKTSGSSEIKLFCCPPTTINPKSTHYLKAAEEWNKEQHFFFLTDRTEKNAPRKYGERDHKNHRQMCLERGDFGRQCSCFIGNPTLDI